MSDLTIFLARLIGAYCLVVAVTMLVRRRETVRTINAMVADGGQIMIAGVIALGAGLAVILGHNIWTGGAVTIAVTIVGWVVALKGVSLLALPAGGLRRGFNAFHYERLFYVYMIATAALGAWLAWASTLP